MIKEKAVVVCIVTYNSAADLTHCLESVGNLDYRPLSVMVVDCASTDDSVAIARDNAPAGLDFRVIPLDSNQGFAGGMNVALRETDAPYALTLNPDTSPASDFVTRLVECIETHPDHRIGAVTGRLVRPADGELRRIDACGMYLTPTWRHLDRGSGEIDRGQWTTSERVFGATAAAALFAREALDDIAIQSDFFAREFHSYREDAELCLRFCERQWEVLYEPLATCEHRRANTPRRRRAMAPEINYHSLKNRYLLRAYHQQPANLIMTLLPTLWRDLLAFGYAAAAERTSLRAYTWLWRNRSFIWQRRRLIASRRTCSPRDLNRWFFRRSSPL